MTTAVLDFHGVASLLDTVLATAPAHFAPLLRILTTADERLEARIVLTIVVQCKDPLAPLNTLCRDGLQAAADLDTLLQHPERAPARTIRRATALLNLCDTLLAQTNPRTRDRRKRIRKLRPQLKLAAIAEQDTHARTIATRKHAQQAALPTLWELLETYLARNARSIVPDSREPTVLVD